MDASAQVYPMLDGGAPAGAAGGGAVPHYPASGVRHEGNGAWGFPRRACDPFRWDWDGGTMKLTLGNIMLYKPDGTLVKKADMELTLGTGDTWLFLTLTHETGAIDIGSTTESEAAAQTSESDRNAGVQKIPLYQFTVAGSECECALDYIHHGAVATVMR